MNLIYIPSQAVYSPWFNASTQPPVRSGPYQVRSLSSWNYKHLLGFRYFGASDGLSGQWRHSMYGPRCTVGRADLAYEWRGLLATYEQLLLENGIKHSPLPADSDIGVSGATFTLPATLTLSGSNGLRLTPEK